MTQGAPLRYKRACIDAFQTDMHVFAEVEESRAVALASSLQTDVLTNRCKRTCRSEGFARAGVCIAANGCPISWNDAQ